MSTYQSEQFPLPTPGRLRRELRLRAPPWWMVVALVIAVVATWIPLSLAYYARRTHSDQPRIHWFLDMDKQPRYGPQGSHPWFQDGRAMRLPVDGTIPRGQWSDDDHFEHGYVRGADGGAASTAVEYFDGLPAAVTVDDSLLARGRDRYQIFCSVCHGASGQGEGAVNLRAMELQEPKWVPATNLLAPEVRALRDGQMFQAIRDGVRNMPAYGAQLNAADRWAIVAWVRHLQEQSDEP